MVSEIVCYGPFDRMPENLLDNIYWFGGWECRTPGIVDKMREHGIENPYRDMINNESVYLIDDQIDLTMAYIHEYYDENAEAVFIKNSRKMWICTRSGAKAARNARLFGFTAGVYTENVQNHSIFRRYVYSTRHFRRKQSAYSS